MRELCIHHHLGLGDHLDCNGMVRYILKKDPFDFSKVYVFSTSNLFNMIEYMYLDEDHIEVIKIDKNLNEDEQVRSFLKDKKDTGYLRVGFEHYPTGRDIVDNKNCWEYFYDQVKIPYSVRTDYFYVKRDEEEESKLLEELNPEHKPYIFVHDDPERGMVLDRLDPKDFHVIRNDNTKNIFHFIKVLENAKEIHCMESSFKSLIDIYAKTADLYYHDLRGHPLGEQTNREWEIVKYA